LYTFRQRLGVALFERVLTIAVQACIEAGLVANELIHFDLTAVVASGHRWSPYERVVILSKALIRLCWPKTLSVRRGRCLELPMAPEYAWWAEERTGVWCGG
jgi:hypothetical protein